MRLCYVNLKMSYMSSLKKWTKLVLIVQQAALKRTIAGLDHHRRSEAHVRTLNPLNLTTLSFCLVKEGCIIGEINNTGFHNLRTEHSWGSDRGHKKTSQRKSKQNMFSLPTTFQSQVWRYFIVLNSNCQSLFCK